jgi:hypothetical protein
MYSRIILINTKYLIFGVDNIIEFNIEKFDFGFYVELPFLFIHTFWR